MDWTNTAMQPSALNILFTTSIAWSLWKLSRAIYNVYFHPLSRFPGPRVAAATKWWHAYIEVFKKISFSFKLAELHATYGDVVRIGTNEACLLHFSDPSAYLEIYNNKNKWDKDKEFYQTFDNALSSFGFLTYREAKERKDVLAPLFSRTAIVNMQGLVQDNVDALCGAFEAQYIAGKSSDLFFGFRCFTVDTITSFCYAKSINATHEPDFKAPVIEAMEATLPMSVAFKNFPSLRRMLLSFPRWLSLKLNPRFEGVVKLRAMLRKQITDVLNNPAQLEDAPHPIIYHELLSTEAHKGRLLPSEKSLNEEARNLLFAGSDTVGTALMVGAYYLLKRPEAMKKLQEELIATWPDLEDKPRFEVMEKLPYLTAFIKESLRLSPGVVSGLPRVVPPSGATICNVFVPGGTIVSQSALYVHLSESIFASAKEFVPDRWLQHESKSLETHLVAFSKGPRSCLGINLAYCELYIAFANVFRRFDLVVDESKPVDLQYIDCFLPHYTGQHLHAFCKPKDASAWC